ncbi:MAG: PAS domain S-box protein [Bacteroidia bacterium]
MSRSSNVSHRLLKRQLRKYLSVEDVESGKFDSFLNAVSQAYAEYDEDLKRTEHILEESSKELFKANKELRKIADDKAKEAKQMANRLKSAAESISEVIFQLNKNGEFIYLNKAWAEVTQYPLADSLEKSILEFVHAADVATVNETLESLKSGAAENATCQARFITKNNSERWVHLGVKGTKNENDEIIEFSGSIADITENYLTQKENAQLALIVQKTRNIMVLTDVQGRVTWVNEAFTALTEYTLDEVKGQRPGKYLQGEKTDPNTKKRIGQHLSTKKSFYGEILNYSKSGREYWLELNIDPYYNEEGEHLGYIAVENEITDRKLQEEEIINSEAKISAVINTIPDFIFYKNDKSKYELVNKAFAEFLGRTPEEIVGKTDFDIYDQGIASSINEDDLKFFKEVSTVSIEGELIDKNNGKILLETTKSTVVDQNGKIKGLVGISRDVTEVRNAQKEIIANEERLKLTTTSLNIGIFDWDVENNNLIWDESMYRLYGIKAEDFSGAYEAFENILDPIELKRVNEEVANSLATGEKFDTSFKIPRSDGSTKYIKADATVFLENGKAKRMVGINYDITEQKEWEITLQDYTESLEKINAELDQFAYVVSHDLKAPLRAINNLSTWIEEDLEGKLDDETQDQFNLLRGRVHRMEGLINGILEYSRAGRIKANNQQIETQKVVEELCDTLKTSDSINFEIAGTFPDLYTEKVALEQVLSNLISNAIKYNDKEETNVKVSCLPKAGFVEFSVSDNGPGIKESYFEKIFVIFQTLQARDQFESTGVGLAIVKKIIEDKNGKIWLESEVGKGTTFYFTWPIEIKTEILNNNEN